jgi:hypothetical protein
MNKRLPCYIVSDLLPLYQDDILSEQTKKDIDKHLTECRECQKKMAAMKTQLDIQNTNVDLKINPLKKVRFYQKILTVLGAVIAFILGACIPIAILGFTVLERGEIAAYQIERVKGLWYVLTSWSCASACWTAWSGPRRRWQTPSASARAIFRGWRRGSYGS